MIEYEITHHSDGPSECFPAGYDKEGLLNISTIGKYWATFLHPDTGQIIECEDFYQQAVKDAKAL